MSLVEIKNISAGYSKEMVVENISFEIGQGEIVGLLGVNGSGKSTFVKALCNILSHNGDVIIDGKNTTGLKAKALANLISYIPQHSGISLDMSVLDVVMMGFNPKLKLLENPGKAMKEKASEVLTMVGLGEKLYNNYMMLSEGQKQLVILARALISDGTLLIMDEPESALDFSVRYRMMSIIKGWIKDGGKSGIITLHDTSLALNYCDRLILLKDKKIAGIIDTKSDTIEEIESKLNMIYGQVRVIKAKGSSGRDSLVMIYDSEEV